MDGERGRQLSAQRGRIPRGHEEGAEEGTYRERLTRVGLVAHRVPHPHRAVAQDAALDAGTFGRAKPFEEGRVLHPAGQRHARDARGRDFQDDTPDVQAIADG